jgi:methionine-rich copper-binding protein CopC
MRCSLFAEDRELIARGIAMNRSYQSWPLALIVAFALMFAGVGSASAHAEFQSSEPAADSTVAAAPERVTIVFTEEVEPSGNSITVTGASGALVSDGEVVLEQSDPNRATISVALKSNLPGGVYTVAWKNAGADGHSEEGSFSFTIGAGAAQPATSSGGSTSAPASLPRTAGETLPISAAVVAALLLGFGLALRRRAVR